MNKHSILLFVSLLVLSQASLTCCEENTLRVTGAGAVKVDPDIALFTISANELGKTSADALSKVNFLINKANTILQTYGLPVENRTTSSINLSP